MLKNVYRIDKIILKIGLLALFHENNIYYKKLHIKTSKKI